MDLVRALEIDAARVAAEIEAAITRQVRVVLHRRGAVLGVSGGVDSAVVCLLCARALGPERVLALFTPDRDSAAESLELGRLVAEQAGVGSLVEPVEPVLVAAGCYRRQAEAIRMVVPEYREGWPMKLVIGEAVTDRVGVPVVVVGDPERGERRARLTPEAFRLLVAATNMKQRQRKAIEYFHADRLGFAVVGTPNRLEYDQGFFVKNGDGAADLKPIAHLYKSQVYMLARELGVPDAIVRRPPTTDTYSMPQTQEEFYFGISLEKLDLCLYARDHDVEPEVVAPQVALSAHEVRSLYRDIDSKRRAARYLRLPPLLAGEVPEPVD